MSEIETGTVAAAPIADSTVVSTPSPEVIAPDISAASVVETSPAPEVIADISEPVISTEAAPAEENVLGDASDQSTIDNKAEEAKVDDKKIDEKVVEPTEAKIAEKFEIESFKLPEGMKFEKEPAEAFSKLLSELESGTLDHATLQEKGQSLIDMHVKGVQESIQRLNEYYTNVHNTQKREWFDSFKADPELGGNDTKVKETVSAVRSAIESFGGNESQVNDFRTLMKTTGVGNHPAMIRLVTNMAKELSKYTSESDNKMLPASSPAKVAGKAYQQFYQSK